MEQNYHFITAVQVTGAENLKQVCMAVDMCTCLCVFVYLFQEVVWTNVYDVAISSFSCFHDRMNEENI